MKNIFIILFAMALLFGIYEWFYGRSPEKTATNYAPAFSKAAVEIGGEEISVEIADEPAERVRGLSGRESMGENEGLLFVFDEPGFHEFWMKDMRFPIDLIWIGENLAVLDLAENISPETYPRTFSPPSPVRYVLEVSAGLSRRADIKKGSILKLWPNF